LEAHFGVYRAAGFGGWFVTHRQGFVPATTQKGKTTMKKMIVGGLAATAVATSGLALAAPAQASPGGVYVTSTVYWTGPDCIPVRISAGYSTEIGMACGHYAQRSYFALPGQFVGADPMPFDTTTTLGCSLVINGVPDNTDYARDGDHHDINCLRVYVPGGYYGGRETA
jgi:hypothetical protein